MLEILVRNAHGNLSESHRDYAAKKLGKLDRYFQSASKVEMTHLEEKLGHRVEVKVFTDGYILRGESTDEKVHAAIDKVADKLEQRLRKLKTKLVKRHRQRSEQIPMGLEDIPENELPDDANHLVENRSYTLKPMTLEEAILQMELMDRDVFAFCRSDSQAVEVLYRRPKGGLGILSPEH